MYGNDRLGAGRDLSLDFRRIHLKGFTVYIHKNGQGAVGQHRADGGNECVGRHKHLVARLDVHLRQSDHQRIGAVHYRQRSLGTDGTGPFLLKFKYRIRPRPHAAPHDFEQTLLVGFGVPLRPLGPLNFAPGGRTAEQGGLIRQGAADHRSRDGCPYYGPQASQGVSLHKLPAGDVAF